MIIPGGDGLPNAPPALSFYTQPDQEGLMKRKDALWLPLLIASAIWAAASSARADDADGERAEAASSTLAMVDAPRASAAGEPPEADDSEPDQTAWPGRDRERWRRFGRARPDRGREH